MQPLYRIILKKAWDITKKYKFLWIFGIFALLLGNGGEMQIFFRTLYAVQDLSGSQLPGVLNSLFLIDFIKNASNLTSVLIWIIFVAIDLFVLLVLAWIITISQIAIIKVVNGLSSNKKSTFKTAFVESQQYFPRVLGLNIICEVLIGLFVFLLIIPLLLVIATAGSQFKFLIGIIVFVIFLPIAIIISFVIRYAINYVVIKGEKFGASISRAWLLFKTNWLISLEMTLALLIINSIIWIIVLYLTIIIIGPYLRMDLMTIFAFKNVVWGLIFFKILPLFVLYLFAGAFVAVFQIASWTLLFNELVESKRYSKLVRIIASLSNYTKTKNQIVNKSDLAKMPKKESKVVVKRRAGRPKAK